MPAIAPFVRSGAGPPAPARHHGGMTCRQRQTQPIRPSAALASICNRLSSRWQRLSSRLRGARATKQHRGMQYALPSTCERSVPSAGQLGVTLIELMVGVMVLSIILLVGVPSFQGTIASNRLTSSTNELVSSMALARSEAIRRGARVTVCKSANGAACTSAGTWQQGWIVFLDTTRAAGDPVVDAGETVLSVVGALPANVTVQGTAPVATFMSFAADGTVRTMTGTALSGTIRVCSTSSSLADANRGRELNISSAGRMATTTVSVGVACVAPT